MFVERKTENHYFAFDPATEGVLSVYVDGSFFSDVPDGTETMLLASGWAIADSEERLVGYGGTHFTTPFTRSSEVSELKAILSFLDAFTTEFPERRNKDFPVVLISDNQNLVNHFNNSLLMEEEYWYCQERYGQEYSRLLDYLEVMDLSLSWVKGHYLNNFNRLADRIANKAYQQVTYQGSFTTEERGEYCSYLRGLLERGKNPFNYKPKALSHQQLRNMIMDSGCEVLTELPTLWVGLKLVEHEGRTFSGFTYTNSDFSFQGSKVDVHTESPVELYLNLRELNAALEQYCTGKELPEVLLVRTNSESLSSLVNNTKSKKWKPFREEDNFQEEYDKLMDFKESCTLIALEISDGRRTYVKFPDMKKSSAFIEENSRSLLQAALNLP